MENETRRRRRRYPATRETPWSNLDIVTFFLAAVFTVMITINGLSALVHSLQEEAALEAAQEAESQPYYMTFIRGVWGAAAGRETEEPDDPVYDTHVDISRYANDSGDAGKLYKLRNEYPQVYAILSHYEEIPSRLISLCLSNPETMDYAAQYVTLAGQEQEIDLTQEAESGTVPLLLQWDTRWGYDTYGDGLLGYTGCAPTCLSMVALYLTKDASLHPGAVAAWADSAGYYVDGVGSAWSLLNEGCEHFGITAQILTLSEREMVQALEAGKPIICSMKPGDFTSSGHYIVVTGYENGEFTVNDPNSKERSGQTWSYARLSGQIKNLWAYQKQ